MHLQLYPPLQNCKTNLKIVDKIEPRKYLNRTAFEVERYCHLSAGDFSPQSSMGAVDKSVHSLKTAAGHPRTEKNFLGIVSIREVHTFDTNREVIKYKVYLVEPRNTSPTCLLSGLLWSWTLEITVWTSKDGN